MKILIMPSWYKSLESDNPYAGIFHFEQAVELSKNCDVAIYFIFDRTLRVRRDWREEDGIKTYRSRFKDKSRIGNWFRVIKTFAYINKEFKPDIIYAHVASEVGRYAVILGKIFRKPVVITEHSAIEYSGFETGFGRKMGEFVYSNSQCNICVSEDLQYKTEKLFPQNKFCTIYNGVIKPEVIESAQMRYRVENTINIALVALLYSYDIKGIQYVIPAISMLVNEGYAVMLHIVGGGTCLNYFQEMASEYNVADNCFFYGYCDKQKVYNIINEMDFLLSASLIETFGCTLAEAMMLGKPVLSTKSGGPDFFVNENVGILIEKGSTEAIVNGIKEMIVKYKDFDSDYIEEYADSKFEMSGVCEKYTNLFQKILESEL